MSFIWVMVAQGKQLLYYLHMHAYIAPENVSGTGPFLFLAGSIEMGKAEHWQDEVIEALADTNWTILNPRRASWDVCDTGYSHSEQVKWELDNLARADKILMYFAPGTKSPISLLELGLFADSKKLIVVCPEGFWRKGNVDIVCERYDVTQVDSLQEAIELLQE